MPINHDDEFHGTINQGNRFPDDWFLEPIKRPGIKNLDNFEIDFPGVLKDD